MKLFLVFVFFVSTFTTNLFGQEEDIQSVKEYLYSMENSDSFNNPSSMQLTEIFQQDIFKIGNGKLNKLSPLAKKQFMSNLDFNIMKELLKRVFDKIVSEGITYFFDKQFVNEYNLDTASFLFKLGANYKSGEFAILGGGPLWASKDLFNSCIDISKMSKFLVEMPLKKGSNQKDFGIKIPCKDENLAARIEQGLKSNSIILKVTFKLNSEVKPVKTIQYFVSSGGFGSTKGTISEQKIESLAIQAKEIKIEFIEKNSENSIISFSIPEAIN